jgi:hypothetical protein
MRTDFEKEIFYQILLSNTGNYWAIKIISILLNNALLSQKVKKKLLIWSKSQILKELVESSYGETIKKNIAEILPKKKRYKLKRNIKLINPKPDDAVLLLIKWILSPAIPFMTTVIFFSAIFYLPLQIIKSIPEKKISSTIQEKSFYITDDFISEYYTPPPSPLELSPPTGLRVINE